MVLAQEFSVLVIEPQDKLTQRLQRLLTEIQHQKFFTVSHFANKAIHINTAPLGQDPLQVVENMAPQLVILDPFYTPTDSTLNGFQLCEALKKNAQTDSIPVFLSKTDGDNLDAFRMKSLVTGANDFIVLSAQPNEHEMQKVWAKIQFALSYENKIREAKALTTQLNQLNAEISKRNVQIENDLYVARQLQQSLLPEPIAITDEPPSELEFQPSKRHFKNDHVRISGLYLPCDALGGDLYDVMHFADDNNIGVTVADVSGHGVPAGFITAIFKAAFYRLTHIYKSPEQVLFHLNNELAHIITSGHYITSVFLYISEDGQTLTYSGAGHPYPLYYQKEAGNIQRLDKNGPPLVWFPDMEYPVCTIALSPGDKVLLFSDGISEMKNPQRDMLGEEALEQMFLSFISDSGITILDKMAYKLSDFTEGHPLEDDVSMVLIEVL